MSRTPSPRPFRLSDALLLIVALAVRLGAIKFVAAFNEGILADVNQSTLFTEAWDQRLVAWEILVMACCGYVAILVTALSTVLLGLRLRRPRPRLRKVWRQPGAVACAACLLPVVGWGVTVAGQAIVGRWAGIPWKEVNFTMDFSEGAGFVILGIWFAFWVGRIARPERSWIDRSGRALGVVTILLSLTSSLVPAWLEATMARPTNFVHSPAPVSLLGTPAPPTPPVPTSMPPAEEPD